MNRYILLHCFLVSLSVSVIASFLTMEVSYPTEPTKKEIEASKTIDYMIKHEWKEITDPNTLKKIDKYKKENPTKIVQLTGGGVTHAGYWIIYFDKFIIWFLGLITGTYIVSYLNLRVKNA